MKSKLKIIFKVLVYLFAIIGVVFTAVFFGMKFGLFNVKGTIYSRNQFFGTKSSSNVCDNKNYSCEWTETPEWAVVKGGLIKDKDIILKVSKETGVSPRMIAAVVVPEQTRFFTSNREIFKSYFEPLKILGSMTQFSLGVSGIKQGTAVQIENYASNSNSDLYPGTGMSDLIKYTDQSKHDTELFDRLTDPKNHYYQYLYTALFIKEVESQWAKAGYDVSVQPGVIVTLFNVGFGVSHPNATPVIAGAQIDTGGKKYSYGELGALFYNSNELSDVFQK